MLIDTGLDDNAQALVQALKKEGVRSLDALIVTHFDKDHIGGAQQILETFSVAMVLEPDYTKDAKTYKRYRQALEESHAQRYTLSSDASFTLDGASYRVDATAGVLLRAGREQQFFFSGYGAMGGYVVFADRGERAGSAAWMSCSNKALHRAMCSKCRIMGG